MTTKRVLIIDDEAHVRLLIERLLEDLEEEGAEILTAADGTLGLELIRSERPNLVFLDVMLPGTNGFDICRTVKQEWQMHDTFIVLLTAKGQKQDAQTGIRVGADSYMTKPFSPDALLQLARKVLDL